MATIVLVENTQYEDVIAIQVNIFENEGYARNFVSHINNDEDRPYETARIIPASQYVSIPRLID